MKPGIKAMGLVCLGALLVTACGPRNPSRRDAGPEEDAGFDAGIPDAGRPAGEDPPTRYSLAVKNPEDGGTGTRIGVGLSLALDQHGQPMLAYVHEDPNGDGVKQDNTLVFTRWNGADRSFQDLKLVDTVADLPLGHPHRQVSLARDPTTGRLGIAYVVAGTRIRLALSDDEGASWDLSTATASGTDPVGNPSLALFGGAIHLAYWKASERCSSGACGAVLYRTGTAAAALSTATAPLPTGAVENPNLPLSLAVDSQGKVGIAYFAGTSPTQVTLGFWRPPGTAVGTVVESANAQPDPSVSLTFGGELPRVAYHLNATDPLVQLRYSAGTDAAGATWSTPVVIPRNGPVNAPDTTRWYQAVAIDPGSGKVAVAANYETASSPNLQCGGPKLARSSNGADFTVCSPDNGRVFGFAGQWVNLAYAKDKLTLAFTYESRANPSVPGGGVVLWREP